MNELDKLKRETFLKMANSGEIAHNSDNENWVNELIQVGYNHAMEWRTLEFWAEMPYKPQYNAPLIFKYNEEWQGKLTGKVIYEHYDNSNELVMRLIGNCPNGSQLLWKPL